MKNRNTLVFIAVIFVAASCKNPGRSSVPDPETTKGASGSTQETTPDEPEPVVEVPATPLPEEFRGGWCMKKLWSPPHESPHFWANTSFTDEAFSVAEGESSKDSGSWSIEGSYSVTGGTGTKQDPYVITMKITKGGGSDTHGYPEDAGPGRDGDVIEGKVSLEDERLYIQLPGTSQDLHRPPCDGETD